MTTVTKQANDGWKIGERQDVRHTIGENRWNRPFEIDGAVDETVSVDWTVGHSVFW